MVLGDLGVYSGSRTSWRVEGIAIGLQHDTLCDDMNHDQQNIWVIVLNPYVGQHYILLPSGAMGCPPYPTRSPANSWLIPATEGFTLLARTAENHQRIRSTNCRAQRTNRRIGPGPTRKSGPNPCGSVDPWSHTPATNWHFRHWWTAVAGRNAAKRRAIQLPLDVMGYRKLDVVGFVVVVADIVVDVVAGSPGLERVAAPFFFIQQSSTSNVSFARQWKVLPIDLKIICFFEGGFICKVSQSTVRTCKNEKRF